MIIPLLAPEIVLKRPYNEAVDIWSLGIILYAMLCGYFPFGSGLDAKETRKRIVKQKVQFPADVCSPCAKDLIERLLCKDRKKRIVVSDIFQHPWMHRGDFGTKIQV